MLRKIYALLILLATIGALISAYLYFFVYYTSTITIHANVDTYKVSFFSKKTARKWEHECPDTQCEIPDVAPLEYRISIYKTDYQSQTLSIDVAPRRNEDIFIELKKQPQLTKIDVPAIVENKADILARLKQKNKYIATYPLDTGERLLFEPRWDTVVAIYETNDQHIEIQAFPLQDAQNLYGEYIYGTEEIFFRVGNLSYIYNISRGELIELPFDIEILYVKTSPQPWMYYIVTKQGTFLYDSLNNRSEYQYIFHDFIHTTETYVGIIYDDETQKKKNFSFTQPGHLIVQYHPTEKTRDVLYTLETYPERIEYRDEKVILILDGDIYELTNF